VRVLIKIGGTLLDVAESRARLAGEIVELSGSAEVAVVHGGGKQMTRYLDRNGVESRFVNGLRVTTPEVLDAVLKVFAGTVNAELVSALRAAGARPVGLTGIDAGLVDAEPLDPELGHVGRPVRSDPRLLQVLIGAGYLPVIACVAGDAQGGIYNVNGDQMAAACASAFGAEKLVFLTDVEGVRNQTGETLTMLTAAGARELIESGVANGGMQAKLEAALCALHGKVVEIVIAPGAHSGILDQLMANKTIGTRVVL
jgi:acetylglutamate kinase